MNPGVEVSSPQGGIVGRFDGKKVHWTFFLYRLTPSSEEERHEPRFKVSSPHSGIVGTNVFSSIVILDMLNEPDSKTGRCKQNRIL
ncbi:hypothetical protein [[Clostridium] aminophilum]|uniref:hypothetical protein n=1 Tax=[Clostridium] aminophilum TaxID=1526 RepID=UPI0011605484|nr:hypothetical protein [[Clostridium] aminophilum]